MQVAQRTPHPSLSEKLLHSYELYGWSMCLMETPVVQLVRLLEDEARLRGYTLSRWHTNDQMRGYPKAITYGIHEGPRPRRSADCRLFVTLRNLEGKTKRCEAFVKLAKFLHVISRLDGMSGQKYSSERITCGTCGQFTHFHCRLYANDYWNPHWLACGQYRVVGEQDA